MTCTGYGFFLVFNFFKIDKVLISSKTHLSENHSYTTNIFFSYGRWGLHLKPLLKASRIFYHIVHMPIGACWVCVSCKYSFKNKTKQDRNICHDIPRKFIFVDVKIDIYWALYLYMLTIECYWALRNKTLYAFPPNNTSWYWT